MSEMKHNKFVISLFVYKNTIDVTYKLSLVTLCYI